MKKFVRLVLICIISIVASTSISGALEFSKVFDKFCKESYFQSARMHDSIIYLYPEGMSREVNVKNDMVLFGKKLHLFFMGTDSSFLLKFWGDSNGYVIHTASDGGKIDSVVGTAKNILEDGADILLNKNTTPVDHKNVWKFIKNRNGTYVIKNYANGMYLSLKERGLDKDKNVIIQSKTPMNWDIVCYKDKFSIPWMSKIPDDRLLSKINIPGAHDTGSIYLDRAISKMSVNQCQFFTPRQQLNAGVRMFDIRCDARKGEDPPLVHVFPCLEGISNTMRLSEIFNITEDFLEKNPTETVIFLISTDSGAIHYGHDYRMEQILSKYIYQERIWAGTEVPLLKDVRGKIVLMRNFDVSEKNLYDIPKSNFGLDMSSWKDDAAYAAAKQALRLEHGAPAWIQDHFNCGSDEKLQYFKQTLFQAANFNRIPDNEFVLNFSSCIKPSMFQGARVVNSYIASKNVLKSANRYGIIVMDYVTANIARNIYMTNF